MNDFVPFLPRLYWAKAILPIIALHRRRRPLMIDIIAQHQLVEYIEQQGVAEQDGKIVNHVPPFAQLNANVGTIPNAWLLPNQIGLTGR